jgi:hypothetical protein
MPHSPKAGGIYTSILRPQLPLCARLFQNNKQLSMTTPQYTACRTAESEGHFHRPSLQALHFSDTVVCPKLPYSAKLQFILTINEANQTSLVLPNTQVLLHYVCYSFLVASQSLPKNHLLTISIHLNCICWSLIHFRQSDQYS